MPKEHGSMQRKSCRGRDLSGWPTTCMGAAGRQLLCVFCLQFRASIPANCLATVSPVSLGGLPCSKMFLVILTNNPTRQHSPYLPKNAQRLSNVPKV